MNSVERIVHGLVKRNLRLKRWIVRAYQGSFLVLPLPRLRARAPVTTRAGYFFGFHDKSPWSADDRMLLAHRSMIPDQPVEAGDEAEIGVFEGEDWTSWRPLARTRAWDWQLGAMLQWVGETDRLVFNDHEDGRHVARVMTAAGEPVATLPRAVVALSPDGRYAASYDFARVHHAMPGYGYAIGTGPVPPPDRPGPEGSLRVMDMATGADRELFSVADIIAVDPHPSMEGAFHYFHHCLFSPGGERFVFFHRWVEPGSRRWTRMYSCDLEGGELFRFPTSDMVSHIGWRDADHILAYAATPEEGDRYHLFRDRSDEVRVVGRDAFDSDGHPQYSPDRRLILTDSYPDRFRFQRLAILEPEGGTRIDIARTRLPWKFRGQLQVDLHPRWSRSGGHVCFDSGHTGRRSLCTMPVDELVHELAGAS
jgi:hypothetical protein